VDVAFEDMKTDSGNRSSSAGSQRRRERREPID
jgi:hypothetical protein